MELVSPASVPKQVKKKPRRSEGNKHNAAAAKLLFEVAGSITASEVDEDESVPASWEDIEDPDFPDVKPAASSSDCCSDGTADDWFDVKPGQLESTKWSMTFYKQASTPPVRCTDWAPLTTASFSTGANAQSKNSGKKNKNRSFHLFRPGIDDKGEPDSDPATKWKEQFSSRYAGVTTAFYDSHCHLDFLFKRSGFSGSFAKYRQCYADTFPSTFAGCVSVFCNPRTWTYESEGKICILLFQLCVIRISTCAPAVLLLA